MIAQRQGLVEPGWNTIIWKYMPLEKFIYLLTENKLFFNNATGFSDKLEGVIPFDTQAYMRANYKEFMKTVEGPGITFDEQMKNIQSSMRDYWINCWSMDRDESYALWKIYLSGSRSGIAIRTNIKRLKDAINRADTEGQPDVYLSKVTYSEFLKPFDFDPWKILTNKSRHYKYERELRLLLKPNWNDPAMTYLIDRRGTGISVDLDVLIEKIYLSPFVGSWFREPFNSLLLKFAPYLHDRVFHSRVEDA